MTSAGYAAIALATVLVLSNSARSESAVVIARGSTIVAEGDSLTYGMDVSPAGVPTQINGAPQTRSTEPFPETLAQRLRGCAAVANHGYPGDRSVDGLVRWQTLSHANLAILMYGSNDALNNGRAPTGIVSIDTFRSVLNLLIHRRQAEGSQVVLLSPPPIGNEHQERLIAPFRAVVRKTATDLGLTFIDTEEVLRNVVPIWTEDKVHLSTAANTAIADRLAKTIHCQ
ncbi:GDSL-type esterase/lipase family protein [Bradyrhizobium sp. Arg816]|uniref:SGNH/GDSL hydrolase family protein n=1 Tax=Bradyrhizobium sp. Arg816 TaxID=2998491 RepID=UPI00249DE220|nr:GDSL-type esterase/lipase family protein [Bradyrhizobium sp. Arg816]MDI3566438.1 GDSL-type esterase/lipase family protein [Bradyrhizobium sp. Arg816]